MVLPAVAMTVGAALGGLNLAADVDMGAAAATATGTVSSVLSSVTSVAASVASSSAAASASSVVSSAVSSAISSAASSVITSSAAPSLTLSTVYSTTEYTITSCAPTVTDCPARIGQVTTEVISLYTTYCPVGATETGKPQGPAVTSSGVPAQQTVYSTQVITISSCAPTVTDCPYRTAPVTVTTSFPVSTGVPTKPTGGNGNGNGNGNNGNGNGNGQSSVVVPAVPTSPVTTPAAPLLSTVAVSTCIPTVITSVITVTPAAGTPVGTVGHPAGTGVSSYFPSGTGAVKPLNSTVPFTAGASNKVAGGLLMAVGLAAALL